MIHLSDSLVMMNFHQSCYFFLNVFLISFTHFFFSSFSIPRKKSDRNFLDVLKKNCSEKGGAKTKIGILKLSEVLTACQNTNYLQL